MIGMGRNHTHCVQTNNDCDGLFVKCLGPLMTASKIELSGNSYKDICSVNKLVLDFMSVTGKHVDGRMMKIMDIINI